MTTSNKDNPGQGNQWTQKDEGQRILNTQDRRDESTRINEEELAENDKRGIDNPELNRDRNPSFDKDRDFDSEENLDENDDFLTNDLDDENDEDYQKSRTDDEDFDDEPRQTKQNQTRTGSETNPDSNPL